MFCRLRTAGARFHEFQDGASLSVMRQPPFIRSMRACEKMSRSRTSEPSRRMRSAHSLPLVAKSAESSHGIGADNRPLDVRNRGPMGADHQPRHEFAGFRRLPVASDYPN